MIDHADEIRIVRLLCAVQGSLLRADKLSGGRWEYQEWENCINRCLDIFQENGITAAPEWFDGPPDEGPASGV